MNRKYTHRCIWKESEITAGAPGWIVDLSPADVVNPDCYWRFGTRKEARGFLVLVNSGVDPYWASCMLDPSIV